MSPIFRSVILSSLRRPIHHIPLRSLIPHSFAAPNLHQNKAPLKVFNIKSVKLFSISVPSKQEIKSQIIHQIKNDSSKYHIVEPKITKEDLLAQADGFFDRFKIRSKWFLIRQNRPFTIDEISAFFSWFVMGNVLWIILGTTTFCSLVLLLVNTVFAKEFAAKITGKFISNGLNLDIDFEDAVFPEWNSGMIKFKNINCTTSEKSKDNAKIKFNLNIEKINLTFSFQKWYDGKGLIRDLEIYGMKGSIHRDSNMSSVEDSSKPEPWIPYNYEISNVKIRDSAVDIYEADQPNPLKVAIFNCELPQLRGNWLLADFFNASNANGSINDSLFTIHKRQNKLAFLNRDENNSNYWKRVTRLRIDSIDLSNIDYNQRFNWIANGKAEITCDIMLPNEIENDDLKLSEVIHNFITNVLDISSNDQANVSLENISNDQPTKSSKYVVIDFKIKFSDLTASIPHSLPRSLNGEPFLSLNDLRSLVSYINHLKSTGKFLLPIQTRILKNLDNLKNSTTLKESGLIDLITTDIYEDLIKHVEEDEKRIIQNRSSLWSHSVASQLLLVGLGVMA